MAREVSREIKIGNDVFTVEPLLGESSFLLQPLLVPILADVAALYGLFTSAVVDLVGLKEGVTPEGVAAAKAKLDQNVMSLLPEVQPALEKAGPIIARLCAKLPAADLQHIMRTLLKGATFNGQQLYTAQGNPIDIVMRGRTLDVWRLLIHALEVSYPDFFDLLRGPAAQPAAEASAT